MPDKSIREIVYKSYACPGKIGGRLCPACLSRADKVVTAIRQKIKDEMPKKSDEGCAMKSTFNKCGCSICTRDKALSDYDTTIDKLFGEVSNEPR